MDTLDNIRELIISKLDEAFMEVSVDAGARGRLGAQHQIEIAVRSDSAGYYNSLSDEAYDAL